MDRNLSLRVIFAGLDRLTAPLRRIGGTSKVTGKDIAATKREVLQLERQAAKIGGYRDLQKAVGDTHAKMDAARQRVRQLEAAIEQADGPTKRLANSLAAANRAVTESERKLATQVASLQRVGSELTEAGTDTRRLSDAEAQLARRLDTVNGKLTEQRARLERVRQASERADKISATGSKLQSAGGSAIATGVAVVAPGVIAAKKAMDFESAMADVKRVVPATSQEFAQLTAQIKNVSRQVPVPPAAVASIAASGAEAGIARTELAAFATDAAKMGVAFKIPAEEAGAMMATWRSAFKMSQPEVVAMADRVNALTATFGGNANSVNDMVTRIGPLGEVAGVAAPALAAIAQRLDRVGVQSEVGATGIKNMMLALTKGEAATKSQNAAFGSLGLSAESVAKRMQVDSQGTILDVLTRISKLDPAKQASTLDQLFGSESIGAIAPLLTDLDALQKNFGLVGDKTRYAGSMQSEFETQAGTSANKLAMATQRVGLMAIELGDKLLPLLITGAEWLGSIADKVTAFSEAHPGLSSAIMLTVTVLGALLATLGSLALTLGGILGAGSYLLKFAGMASTAFAAVRTAAMFLARGVMQAGLMMLANPVVLVITLIVAALAAAGYMIYTHWDKIKAAFASGVTSLGQAWQWVKNQFTNAVAWMAEFPARMATIGLQIVLGLARGIAGAHVAVWNALKSVVMGGIDRVRNMLGIKSPSRVFMGIGGHMTDGLAIGLNKGAGRPLQAVQRLAAGVAASMASAAPLAAAPYTVRSSSGPAATATTASSSVSSGGITITGPITIQLQVPAGADGASIAQQIKAVLAADARAQAARRDASFEDMD